jgi:Beta/Gamma crystallin
MFRLMTALVAGSILIAPAAHADARYTDPLGRFTVTVPTDWIPVTPDNLASNPIALIVANKPAVGMLRLCLAAAGTSPETRSQTQAEINAELKAGVGDEFWRLILVGNSNIKANILSKGVREKNGRHIHHAVATSTSPNPGEKPLKSKSEIQAVPGLSLLMMCATEVEDYNAALPAFDAILTSFEPASGMISQAPANGTSVMTVYTASNYEGAARSFAQSTADLNRLGSGGNVASVSVSGAGLWEVCEGANFTGKCRVLSPAETAASGQALMIASARRHTPRNAIDWARAVAPGALDQARARLEKQ